MTTVIAKAAVIVEIMKTASLFMVFVISLFRFSIIVPLSISIEKRDPAICGARKPGLYLLTLVVPCLVSALEVLG